MNNQFYLEGLARGIDKALVIIDAINKDDDIPERIKLAFLEDKLKSLQNNYLDIEEDYKDISLITREYKEFLKRQDSIIENINNNLDK